MIKGDQRKHAVQYAEWFYLDGGVPRCGDLQVQWAQKCFECQDASSELEHGLFFCAL